MGSSLSRHEHLLDCCPTGVAAFLAGGWRSSGRWGSRGSCGSAAAFAGAGAAASSAGEEAARTGRPGGDDFVPLKGTMGPESRTKQPQLAAESSSLVAPDAEGSRSHHHHHHQYHQQSRQQQMHSTARYGSTNPVSVTTEDEVTPQSCQPVSASQHRSSSISHQEKPQQQQQQQQPQSALDPAERAQLQQEMQWQQQQLQELQRLKIESQFPNKGLGQVHFALHYLIANSALYIRIIRGSNLIAQDSNGLSDPYVKIHLLPDTGKGTKLRTRTCQRTLNPAWDEEFCYSGVLPPDLEKKNLRLTVLDEDTIGYDWLGELVFPLKQLAHGRKECYTVFLQPRNEELERSLTSLAGDRGKILIGLYYSPAKSELTVKVIQCVNLLAMDPNGYSDPFVKLFLKPDRNRNEKFKTDVKKKTLNPEFKEDFVFSSSPQELPMKTLEITVWDKDFGTKNDFIGALLLGNKCSGERLAHWEALLKQPYQTHTMWHPLGAELQPQ